MKQKIDINILDDSLTIGKAIKLLGVLDYDKRCFEKGCIWELSDNHEIYADIRKPNKVSFCIYRKPGHQRTPTQELYTTHYKRIR